MASRVLVAAVLLLHGCSRAHRDGGAEEEDDVQSRPGSEVVNQSAAPAERSTNAHASDNSGVPPAGFGRMPELGSSLMQLSATTGLSAGLEKVMTDACKLNNTGGSHEQVQSLQRCASALAELATRTRTERANSMQANQNYRDDIKLAHQLLKLLEEKTATQKQKFDNFRDNEDTVLTTMMQRLNAAKEWSKGVQQASLVQSRMRPISQASGSWPGGSHLGDPSFARRSRLVGASMDAASLGPEVDNGDVRPSFGVLDREEAALENRDSLEDDQTSLGAGLATMSDLARIGDYGPEASLRARHAAWY